MKEVKPGRFTPRCPKCQKTLSVTVPEDSSQPPIVAALDREGATGTQTSARDILAMLATPGAFAPGETSPQASRGDVSSLASGSNAIPSPSTLGGFRIQELLGRGAMGAVYLAKNLSLPRPVALKVMRPDWARHPTYVSRFTRDAYAAAQLNHPNVVQLYDFGEDDGTTYASMEYVRGPSLAQLIRHVRRLDSEAAAGMVLHAARGLKAAHDQGFVHRDIKPANLLASVEGLVKVADLGLAKTPAVAEVEAAMDAGVSTITRPAAKSLLADAGPITLVNAAMGTPEFMAPEQAQDALGVDGRADIYSLGCTFYLLVTGQPPFEGKTAIELMSKHATEPLAPPETIARDVPKALSDIILKMTAKRPEDRYANVAELIKALEGCLGLPGAHEFLPREEHASLLGECAFGFNNAPTARLRRRIRWGASAGLAALAALAALARQPILVGGLVGLGVMTALAYFVVNGVRRPSFLFDKVRAFLLGGSLVDWLVAVAVLGLSVTLLYVFHLFWGWVFFGIVAALAAMGLHLKVDQPLDAERAEPLEKTRAMLRALRFKGVDEDTIRQFVARYSGKHWDEFFEALFGYEVMLDARRRRGRSERGLFRWKHAAWRDPIIAWIDAKQQARRAARDTKRLQKIEEESLVAQGVNLLTARRKAQRIAEAMVAVAAELKAAAAREETPRPIGRALRDAALKPEQLLVEHESGLIDRRSGGVLAILVGPKVRFLCGALLMAGFLAWVHQNEIVTREHLLRLKDAATKAVETRDVEALRKVDLDIKIDKPTKAVEVDLPRVPAEAARVLGLFNSFNPGVAGLILLVSACFGGIRVGLGAFAGAGVALLGSVLHLPAIGPIDPALTAMVLGGAIAVVAIFFGRER